MDNVCTHSLTHSHSLTQRGCSGEEIWAAFCNEVNLEEKEFFGLQYEPPIPHSPPTACDTTLKMLFPKVTDSHSLLSSVQLVALQIHRGCREDVLEERLINGSHSREFWEVGEPHPHPHPHPVCPSYVSNRCGPKLRQILGFLRALSPLVGPDVLLRFANQLICGGGGTGSVV